MGAVAVSAVAVRTVVGAVAMSTVVRTVAACGGCLLGVFASCAVVFNAVALVAVAVGVVAWREVAESVVA